MADAAPTPKTVPVRRRPAGPSKSETQAVDLASKLRKQLSNMRKATNAAHEHGMETAISTGTEFLSAGTAAATSFTVGWIGQDKVKLFGIDPRPAVGGLVLIGGLTAQLFGYGTAGQLTRSVGRGVFLSWLAERAFIAGVKWGLPAEERAAADLPGWEGARVRGIADHSHDPNVTILRRETARA